MTQQNEAAIIRILSGIIGLVVALGLVLGIETDSLNIAPTAAATRPVKATPHTTHTALPTPTRPLQPTDAPTHIYQWPTPTRETGFDPTPTREVFYAPTLPPRTLPATAVELTPYCINGRMRMNDSGYWLVLYDRPTKSSEQVAVVYPGEEFCIVDADPLAGFYQVVLPSGRATWLDIYAID